ncbi:MAG: hypothetical protein ABH854_00460 [Candidatus Diapherotrites archaeon]|nr:hypothetical protein [Candidatus Micrarchaeota archaeon]MBU1939893.1 hypothetical protein [Candidatus Micrarchaeota archaeon]
MLPSANKELRQAQRYPFSAEAKAIITQHDFNLDEVPEEVLSRAKAMVLSAMKRKPYSPEMRSPEMLRNEVLAYPLAKVLVSCMHNSEFHRRFAKLISDSTFSGLKTEGAEEMLALARGLNIETGSGKGDSTVSFPVKIPLVNYLSADFSREHMKLVNQRVRAGSVELTKAGFADFLSMSAYNAILSSLPVPTQNVPRHLKTIASELEGQWKPIQKKYDFKPTGKVEPDAFPPCMAELYSALVESGNLTHFERFDIATFLVAVGMGKEQIIELFKTLPNFSERITRYQIERISKSKYSSPGCIKIKSHKLCKADCGVKHPLQVYRQGLMRANAKRLPMKKS